LIEIWQVEKKFYIDKVKDIQDSLWKYKVCEQKVWPLIK